MVKPFKTILILALVAGAAWLAWRHFFPDEPGKIRRVFANLAEDLSTSSERKTVSKLMAMDRIQGCFAPNVQVVVDVPGEGRHTIGNREELMGFIQGAMTQMSGVKVEFLDIQVQMDSPQSATADLTARAMKTGQKDILVQEFRVNLAKNDDSWQISRIEPMKVLKPLGAPQ